MGNPENTMLTCITYEQVKYLTDGMLIREAVSDPYLRGYSIIFVDEAHERTVNTDVLLGLLKIAQQNRYDSKHPLKLVVMSATLEEEKMLSFFPSSKPAFIPGRQYPVEVFYTTKKQESYVKGAIDTVLQVRGISLSVSWLFTTSRGNMHVAAPVSVDLSRYNDKYAGS